MSPQCRWCSTWADDPVHRPPFVPGSGHHPFEEDVDWEARYRSLVAALQALQAELDVKSIGSPGWPDESEVAAETAYAEISAQLAALLADAAPETPTP